MDCLRVIAKKTLRDFLGSKVRLRTTWKQPKTWYEKQNMPGGKGPGDIKPGLSALLFWRIAEWSLTLRAIDIGLLFVSTIITEYLWITSLGHSITKLMLLLKNLKNLDYQTHKDKKKDTRQLWTDPEHIRCQNGALRRRRNWRCLAFLWTEVRTRALSYGISRTLLSHKVSNGHMIYNQMTWQKWTKKAEPVKFLS